MYKKIPSNAFYADCDFKNFLQAGRGTPPAGPPPPPGALNPSCGALHFRFFSSDHSQR